MVITKIRLWPFPAIWNSFLISFNDTRWGNYNFVVLSFKLTLRAVWFNFWLSKWLTRKEVNWFHLSVSCYMNLTLTLIDCWLSCLKLCHSWKQNCKLVWGWRSKDVIFLFEKSIVELLKGPKLRETFASCTTSLQPNASNFSNQSYFNPVVGTK
jgi:hypothetical protein